VCQVRFACLAAGACAWSVEPDLLAESLGSPVTGLVLARSRNFADAKPSKPEFKGLSFNRQLALPARP